MSVIYKYPLVITDNQVIEIPASHDVINVGMQDGQPYIWAIVDLKSQIARQVFHIYGTGHECNQPARNHIGTFFDGPFVWHLFKGRTLE